VESAWVIVELGWMELKQIFNTAPFELFNVWIDVNEIEEIPTVELI
jgi:hypothetical protein